MTDPPAGVQQKLKYSSTVFSNDKLFLPETNNWHGPSAFDHQQQNFHGYNLHQYHASTVDGNYPTPHPSNFEAFQQQHFYPSNAQQNAENVSFGRIIAEAAAAPFGENVDGSFLNMDEFSAFSIPEGDGTLTGLIPSIGGPQAASTSTPRGVDINTPSRAKETDDVFKLLTGTTVFSSHLLKFRVEQVKGMLEDAADVNII